MRSLLNSRTWLILSTIWVGAIAYWCFQSWPRLPLDVSSIDPETLAIFENQKWKHVGAHAIAAIVPPIIAYGAGRVLCQLTGGRSAD